MTAQIRCSNCGGMGHISLDCKATTFTPQENSATMDKEVSSVRCEVFSRIQITLTVYDIDIFGDFGLNLAIFEFKR